MSSTESAPQTPASPPTRLAVLLFTDIVGSTDLKSKLGTANYSKILARHNEFFETGIQQTPGSQIIKHTGDGYFASFATASDAVRFALAFQTRMTRENWQPRPITTRLGIHVGEVQLMDMAHRADVIGLSADVAARLMSLAQGGQILLTTQAFNDARQFVNRSPDFIANTTQTGTIQNASTQSASSQTAAPQTDSTKPAPSLRWLAHGPYLFKGADEPLDVFEVGIENISPLTRPPDSEKAKRVVPHDQEPTLGWRPAIGLAIPGRPNWVLERKLGEGGFGEVWLGTHSKLRERRVFKFCFDAERLRSLKREYTLFRLLKESLGQRDDIAKLLEVKLDEPPFFLESEFAKGGNLLDWADRKGGIDAAMPLAERLQLVAKVADAVAAAHSVGILHKDIKPANVFIQERENGTIQPVLADFGIGILADRTRLQKYAVTEMGFTALTIENESSRTGTRMYSPPEALQNKPFTTQGDVYALGILLYQMVVGDLTKPFASGWERDVSDEILRADIAEMVEGDPARRISSAHEVAQRISTLEERRQKKNEQRQSAARANKRRRQVRFAAAAAIVLGLIAVTVIFGFLRERGLRLQLDASSKELAQRTQQAEESALVARQRMIFAEAQVHKHSDPLKTILLLRELPENQSAIPLNLIHETLPRGPIPLALLRHNEVPIRIAFSPDGKRIAAATHDKTALVWPADGSAAPLVLRGHKFALTDIAWSPDGKRIVTASHDKTVRVWNSDASGEPIVLSGHEDAVFRVAWSPDGKLIATAGDDKTARIFNADGSGEPIVIRGHTEAVYHVAFSPDGKRIAISSRDKTVRITNVDGSGEPIVLKGHSETIYAAVWSADGKRIATASDDGTARIWNSDGSGTPIILRGHTASVLTIAWSPDGMRLATASRDRAAAIWNADGSGHPFMLRGHEGSVRAIAWNNDGTQLATASDDKTARIWKTDGSGAFVALQGHDEVVPTLAWSPQGDRLATSSWDNSIRVWNTGGSGEPIVLRGHQHAVDAGVWSPDGKLVATSSQDGTVRIWKSDGSGKPIMHGGHLAFARAIAFSPDSKRIASTSGDKSVRIINTDGTGELTLRGHTDLINTIAWHPDGRRIVTASDDGSARIWTIDTSESRGDPLVLKGHEKPLSAAAWSPDGKRIATASADGTARIWNIDGSKTDGAPIILRGHEDSIVSITWSPDGTKIATASRDNSARIWNTSGSGTPIVLEAHEHSLTAVAWSPDGKRLITTARDPVPRIWNAEGGKSIPLIGHQDNPNSAAWSPDGKRIATASEDHTVRIWNVEQLSGSSITQGIVLRGHEDVVMTAAWSPDGKRILTAADDKTARIWEIDWPRLRQRLLHITSATLTPVERERHLGERRPTTAPSLR